jgi:hypothetical protein
MSNKPLIQVCESVEGDWIKVVNITSDEILFEGHRLTTSDLVYIFEELGYTVQKSFEV